MMWFFIFVGMAVAALAVLIFLVSRFGRFAFVNRIAGDRKWLRILVSALLTAGMTAAFWLLFDTINMVIILVHLGVIWAVCDGLCYLAGRGSGRRPETDERETRTPERESGNRDGSCFGRETGEREIRSPESGTENEGSRCLGHAAGNRNGCYYAGILALGITAVYLGCGWYLAHHVWEKDYVIAAEKDVDDLRIAMFADSHVGTTFHGDGFAREIARIQETNPDVVLIVGDYVDDDTTKEDMEESCAALGTLQTTYGVYFAFGNHDKGYYGNEYRGYSGADLVEELEKNGVRVLQDETVTLGDDFYLIGRQDRSEERHGSSRASMEELMRELDPEKFSIVMDHQPQDYAAQEAAHADLVLSGHTHAGQFFPINNLGEWTRINDRTYGYTKKGDTNFIVTSGISDWAIKFKTGCRSEFVIIDVKGKV